MESESEQLPDRAAAARVSDAVGTLNPGYFALVMGPMVDATRGLIAGTSAVFWAFGTWLIPVLLASGYWRHVVHKLPLRAIGDGEAWFALAAWGIVFVAMLRHLWLTLVLGRGAEPGRQISQ